MIFSLFRIIRESIDTSRNPNGVRINKRMSEVCQSIYYTAQHPNIYLKRYLILQVRVNNFRRSIHWSRHCLHFFFYAIILWFIDLAKIDESIGTWSEVAEFETIILAYQNVLYFHVLMIASCLVNISQSL